MPTTADYAAILANPEVEGVLIVTPNTTHAALTAQAARSGKHVFVEKPIAATVAEGREMQRACENAGVTLMVGHNTRRAGGHRFLKKMVDGGELGTVVMAEANCSHAGGMSLTGAEWRASRADCPAVGLMQLGVHHADTLHYLLGPVTEVTALFAHVATPVDMDDATLSLLRFPSGPLAYLGSSYATPPRIHLALYGTRANAFYDLYGKLQLKWAHGAEESRDIAPVDTVTEELTEFAACIRDRAVPETGAEAGIHALAIVEAAIRSAAEKRTIPIT